MFYVNESLAIMTTVTKKPKLLKEAQNGQLEATEYRRVSQVQVQRYAFRRKKEWRCSLLAAQGSAKITNARVRHSLILLDISACQEWLCTQPFDDRA